MTKSSTEAELVALSDAAAQAIWARNLLIGQGYDIEPLKMYQDNMSTIALVERGRSNSARTRHINIRFFWINGLVEEGQASVEHLATTAMIADILTKPIAGNQFILLRNLLLGEELVDTSAA